MKDFYADAVEAKENRRARIGPAIYNVRRIRELPLPNTDNCLPNNVGSNDLMVVALSNIQESANKTSSSNGTDDTQNDLNPLAHNWYDAEDIKYFHMLDFGVEIEVEIQANWNILHRVSAELAEMNNNEENQQFDNNAEQGILNNELMTPDRPGNHVELSLLETISLEAENIVHLSAADIGVDANRNMLDHATIEPVDLITNKINNTDDGNTNIDLALIAEGNLDSLVTDSALVIVECSAYPDSIISNPQLDNDTVSYNEREITLLEQASYEVGNENVTTEEATGDVQKECTREDIRMPVELNAVDNGTSDDESPIVFTSKDGRIILPDEKFPQPIQEAVDSDTIVKKEGDKFSGKLPFLTKVSIYYIGRNLYIT